MSYKNLLSYVQKFAEILNEQEPELPVNLELKSEADQALKKGGEGDENSTMEDMWGDDETRRFYQDLPDLAPFMPGSYLKEPPKPEPSVSEETLDQETLDQDLTAEEIEEIEKVEKVEEAEPEVEEPQVTNISNKILLDAFFAQLPDCVNRERIDNAAVNFVLNLNTKQNKKKLVKVLFGVSRIRLDLLPFYSRLAAILHTVMPEVANDLCLMLKTDFKYHVQKKDQINIESKIKVVR